MSNLIKTGNYFSIRQKASDDGRLILSKIALQNHNLLELLSRFLRFPLTLWQPNFGPHSDYPLDNPSDLAQRS